MTEFKDSGAFIRMAYYALKELGINAEEVVERVGLTLDQLDDKDLRTPHTAGQLLFWQTVEKVSGDPAIGLHLGEKLPIYKGQVIEYLFLSSPTFGEGLKRAMNYQRLLSDAVQGRLDEDEEGVYMYSDFQGNPIPHLSECIIAGLTKFFSFVTDGAFKPEKIYFHHRPYAPEEEYERIYGCPVFFQQKEPRIYFAKALLDHPSAHAEPELLRLHEQAASEYVARLEKQDLVWQVSRIVGETLESGGANLETVASRLGMKPRLLRTRLADAGTHFNQILADYRCNLAKKLLTRTDESIDEIVYLTGFSEPSTFYRAFKRWVGETPVEFRKKNSKELS